MKEFRALRGNVKREEQRSELEDAFIIRNFENLVAILAKMLGNIKVEIAKQKASLLNRKETKQF